MSQDEKVAAEFKRLADSWYAGWSHKGRQGFIEALRAAFELGKQGYVSSDAQDAARYRWMRSSRWYVQVMSDLMDRYPKFCVIGTELDAAIDAELSKCSISHDQQGGKGRA